MFMMALYTLAITGSAYLFGWLGTRTLLRFSKQLGFDAGYAQVAMTLAMVAFLTVVSMATGVLIAALVGAVAWIVTRSPWLPLAAMVLLATVGVWESPGAWPASVPVIGFLVLAAGIFAASVLAAQTSSTSVPMLVAIATAASLPLMLAPVVFAGAHSSLALDAAIILAALAGGLLVIGDGTHAAALLRVPLSVLMAYGAIQAMHYGAWPLGIVSILIWLAGLKLAPRSIASL